MAATSGQHRHRNRRSLRRLIVDSVNATVGIGGAAARLVRSIDRRRVAPRQARAVGNEASERLRGGRDRSVTGIRRLVDQSITTVRRLPAGTARRGAGLARRGRAAAEPAGADPASAAASETVDRVRAAPGRAKAAATSVGRTAESGAGAARRAASSQRNEGEAKPARAQARTGRTRERRAKPQQARPRQAMPQQAGRGQDLQQYTVQELREQARKSGIKGRYSMTKEELIKALRDQR
jgi:hypothetical protein